ncbi:hypothetical protein ILYODFUR_031281 [Ilyodon furcidens]|uniref:Uncharacterized protein n=1 Tax=Ilyodon furcidens TaxID=33524 RepID=A0ABV0TG21_9TELE
MSKSIDMFWTWPPCSVMLCRRAGPSDWPRWQRELLLPSRLTSRYAEQELDDKMSHSNKDETASCLFQQAVPVWRLPARLFPPDWQRTSSAARTGISAGAAFFCGQEAKPK